MKFFTFQTNSGAQLGAVHNGVHVNLTAAWRHRNGDLAAPYHVGEFIRLGNPALEAAQEILGSSDVGAFSLDPKGIKFLAPIPVPVKNVFCVGRNYREHIIEGNLARGRDPHDFPKAVEFFTKAPTTVTGHRGDVRRHAAVTDFLDYEVELGVVIGKRGINIPREHALDHVFGYTIINDITARDLQVAHGQWFKGKSLDTTCPIGPYVVQTSSVADPHKLRISLSVNDEPRQDANTSSLLFTIPDIIAELSAGLTLEPGDVIATGTPSGVGLGLKPQQKLKVGDVIKARIEGIGELENCIVE